MRNSRRLLVAACPFLLVFALALLAQAPMPSASSADGSSSPEEAPSPTPDITPLAAEALQRFSIQVTEGAAAGYVDDRVCGRCHADLARSYREVAMAQSFYRPSAEKAVEDFSTPFRHGPSQRIYQMRRQGDRYTFRRHQLDEQGREINVFEVDVDWILGSGKHARTYLYRTPQGELYQLPLAWYADDGHGQPARWGIAPGYDQPHHEGVLRRVQRECMFCHNAYPEVPLGSDVRSQPHLYPPELPQGLGCQRCHGPGAAHVGVALAGDATTPETLQSSIVNPGRLSPERRDEVCRSCHLQPTVAIPGLRRFDRADYSYRVGEPYSDYFVTLDVDEAEAERGDRFEINHHPYRLQQSRCFAESPPGQLSCLTCHDPHRKVAKAERAAHFRDACLSCHTVDNCRLEAMKADAPEHGGVERPEGVANDDCAACHMPKRRPTDVVQVLMTDHRIQRRPDVDAYLAPRAESSPVLVGIELLGEDRPRGSVGEVYRAMAVERVGGQEESLAHLAKHLPASGLTDAEPWYQLIKGLIRLRRFEEAHQLASQVQPQFPQQARFTDLLGILRIALGERQEGLVLLRQALDLEPDSPQRHFNLGRVLLAEGNTEEATEMLRRAVDLFPNFVRAWLFLGYAYEQSNHSAEAIDAWQRVLAIEPKNSRGYVALVDILWREGRRGEAESWWHHGRAFASHPDLLSDTWPPSAEVETDEPSTR